MIVFFFCFVFIGLTSQLYRTINNSSNDNHINMSYATRSTMMKYRIEMWCEDWHVLHSNSLRPIHSLGERNAYKLIWTIRISSKQIGEFVWNSNGIRWKQNGARRPIRTSGRIKSYTHMRRRTHINPFNERSNCMCGLWDIYSGLCACHTRLVLQMGRMWRGIISCEEYIYVNYDRNERTSRAHAHGQRTTAQHKKCTCKWNGWKKNRPFSTSIQFTNEIEANEGETEREKWDSIFKYVYIRVEYISSTPVQPLCSGVLHAFNVLAFELIPKLWAFI